MKIDLINSVGFKSKIRIRPQAIEAFDYNGGGFEFCAQLRKLERNGNKDLVVIAPKHNEENNKF